jgi:hypothetical protein
MNGKDRGNASTNNSSILLQRVQDAAHSAKALNTLTGADERGEGS